MSSRATYWLFAALISFSGVVAQPVAGELNEAAEPTALGDVRAKETKLTEVVRQPADLVFFVRQARSDARYEQRLRLEGTREELDFWTDQRAFERELYTQNLAGYKAYIQAKRDVYSTHQQTCDEICHHGDYYYLQASFYLQLGSDSDGNSWMFGPMDSGGGLIAAGPE